jgi:uncharacterized OsmC-like protein
LPTARQVPAHGDLLINEVRSASTGTFGRSLNSVRNHHFVIDEPAARGGPGEELTPADVFLAGIGSCGVLLVESFAREAGLEVKGARAAIRGLRHGSDPSRFVRIVLDFEIAGVSQRDAEQLVRRYEGA